MNEGVKRTMLRWVELFTSTDPADLAAHALALLTEPDRHAALVEAAQRYVRERSWRRVGVEILQVYQSLAGQVPCASLS